MSRRRGPAGRRRPPRLHGRRREGTAAWQLPIAAQAALCNANWSGARLMIGYRALDLGANPLIIGVLAATFAAPALVVALPLGRAIDRWGGPRLALFGILVILLAVTLVLMTAGLPWLLAGSGLFGLGHVTIIIAQQAFVASRSSDRSSSAFGNLTAAVSVGQLIGPPVVTTAAASGRPISAARLTPSPGSWRPRRLRRWLCPSPCSCSIEWARPMRAPSDARRTSN